MLQSRIEETFRVLDLLKFERNFVIAFSGGKDSTLLSILFYKWLKERGVKGKNVIFIHNDTLSELPVLEDYVRDFLSRICKLISETGNNCEIAYTKPQHNFYWRVIVAGYPAPTFIFRWCVNHLKIIPNKTKMKELIDKYGNIVLLTGHREEESISRARSISRNTVCPIGEMSCNSSFFLRIDVNGARKVMPIKDWKVDEIWEFLDEVKDEMQLKGLYVLYGGNKESRYGCWHCTLVKVQKNIYNLPPNYLYLEGLRILYRVVSDLEEMRVKKNWGRTKLGPLNAIGRGVMLKAFPVTERLSGLRFYGLDEELINGYSLREIFYSLDGATADKLIMESAKGLKDRYNRVISIEKIRNVEISSELREKIEKNAVNNFAYSVLSLHDSKFFTDILDEISK